MEEAMVVPIMSEDVSSIVTVSLTLRQNQIKLLLGLVIKTVLMKLSIRSVMMAMEPMRLNLNLSCYLMAVVVQK